MVKLADLFDRRKSKFVKTVVSCDAPNDHTFRVCRHFGDIYNTLTFF